MAKPLSPQKGSEAPTGQCGRCGTGTYGGQCPRCNLEQAQRDRMRDMWKDED